MGAVARAVAALRRFASREPLLAALLALLVVMVAAAGPLRFVRLLPVVVDVNSLCVIIGLMLVSRGLELSGLLSLTASRLLRLARGRGLGAVILLTLLCGFTAAVAMNDASLFVYVPLARALSRIIGVGEEEPVVFMAMAANIGSALTPIGNPQNIILWRYSGASFLYFTYTMAWFSLPALAMLLAYILVRMRGVLGAGRVAPPPPVRPDRRLAAASCILLVLVILLAEAGLQPLGLALVLVAYLAICREVLRGFDYALVAVFILMFIDFGVAARLMASTGIMLPRSGLGLYAASILLSQVVSNVPATILLVGLHADWRITALGVNVAGVGFVLGSLANIIALRLSCTRVRDYHRIALPYFILLTLLYGLLVWAAGYPPYG